MIFIVLRVLCPKVGYFLGRSRIFASLVFCMELASSAGIARRARHQYAEVRNIDYAGFTQFTVGRTAKEEQ